MNWSEQVGSVVCGWLLESYSGMRAGRASFQAVNTTDSRRALFQFVTAGAPGADSLSDHWSRAVRLSDQHILAVYESGETLIGDVRVVYSAQEPVDDEVGEVLRDRSLDLEEARAMTVGVLSGLDYLHEQGLRHGAVAASNLFIVGEDVKLNPDTIAPASEAERRDDLTRFGELLVLALGAKKSSALPSPFREIANDCLARNSAPSAGAMLRRLENPPAANWTSVIPRMPRRAWILAGTGALALIALVALFRSGSEQGPLPPAPVSTAAAPDKPSPAVPFGAVSQAALVRTPSRGEADRVSTSAATLNPRSMSTAKTWAVIAATYNDYDAAQKRANRIANASKLSAGVYPPKGQGGRYYVVLGSGMTQQEAHDLLGRARNAGAPGDSYVTKLNTQDQ